MAKKKQPDFQATKLRPGRILPRGRNVTKTSFKAKKIVVKRMIRKEKLILNIPDSLKQLCGGNASSKTTALNHLNNLILLMANELTHYLPDITDHMSKVILDPDDSVRKAAISVLDTIFELVTDIQIHAFFPILSCALSCAMTHADIKVKESSLAILGMMLKTHPDLIIQSTDILKNLLDFLSNPSQKKSSKSGRKRTLVANYNDSVQSQDWRIQILQYMKQFIRAIVDKKTDEIIEDDNEQEVYWDCEGALQLVIYSGGGLKPVDIDNTKLSNVSSELTKLEHPDQFQEFLSELFPLLSAIYIEEIAGDPSAVEVDDMVSLETVGNLNVIFHVLCDLGDWIKLLCNSDNELDKFFSKLLNDSIIRHIRKFPFLPRNPVFDTKVASKNQAGVRLNLAVCYLYSTFILGSEYCTTSFKKKIISYLKTVVDMNFEVKYESIPVLVKITKNYLSLGDNSLITDIVQSILNRMCSVLGLGKMNDNRKLLISLFMQLSLDPVYEFMSEDYTMKKWFSVLFEELEKMAKNGIADRKLLLDIKKVANRKYPLFLECLEEVDFIVLKNHLACENEDVIDTVIFLISHLNKISNDTLEELSEVILDQSFPIRMSIRLIRLLTHRFTSEDASPEDRINFIQFLLNIALDTVNVSDRKWADYDLPKFKKAWLLCKDVSPFFIYPSLYWKTHSKLFEVCCKSLNQFPKALVTKMGVFVSKELMEFSRKLPVHCAIALLRLNTVGGYERYFECQLQDLVYSSLLLISVFTDIVTDDEWYQWNVVQLMNSIEFTRKTARDTLRVLNFDSKDMQGIIVHYILRVFKFFVTRKMLLIEDRDKVLPILEKCVEHCSDENFKQQTLFIKLFNFFNYYDMR